MHSKKFKSTHLALFFSIGSLLMSFNAKAVDSDTTASDSRTSTADTSAATSDSKDVTSTPNNAPDIFKSYDVDPAHSSIGFEVSHLVVATVEGRFNKFSGSFDYNDNTKKLQHAQIDIDAASINTNEEARDKHLRSADFFNVDKFPKIVFNATNLETTNDGTPSKVYGNITIRGVTQPLNLDVDYKGAVTDPWGGKRIVFNLTGKLNRKDFGLTWNKIFEGSKLMVGDTVTIIIKAEATLKKPSSSQ